MQLLVRALGISDGDMEKGHMRCDANISLRPVGDETLYPKTEVKNINSFRAVERALEYEIRRQTELWKDGTAPAVSSTRGWNDIEMKTNEQRTKEAAHDYRYFPEPDIPPFLIGPLLEQCRRDIPELPAAKRTRFQEEYGFATQDARQLIADEALANYAEQVVSEFFEWVRSSAPDTDETELKKKSAKLISGWLLTKYLGALNDAGRLFTPDTITPENFAEFLTLVYLGKLNSTTGQRVLKQMIETGADPSQIIETEHLGQADGVALDRWIAETIEENPEQIEQFRSGKTAVLQFLVGKVMKKSRGTADPEEVAVQFQEKI